MFDDPRRYLQRIELHRLRQQRDTEVSTLVHTATSKLKTELDHLKVQLQTTNGKLEQAVFEKDHACADKERAMSSLAEAKQTSASHEKAIVERLRSLEDAFSKGSELATSIADSVEVFQRHVLPTFRSNNPDPTKQKTVHETGEARLLMEQVRAYMWSLIGVLYRCTGHLGWRAPVLITLPSFRS